ncbi:MAG: sulfatase/phosphatase domain-containing protein, partial [Chthoniobacteraceae bacterium]
AQHPFDHGNLDGRDERLLPRPLVDSEVRTELAIYYALITDIDAQIGRILKAIEERGMGGDTVIIFTTDQGLAMGSHGLLGKQNQYEHTARVPLILAGPGVPPGRRIDALCQLRDLFPTACELAGIAVPSTVQAASLAPLLRGEKASGRDDVFGYFTDTQRMICDRRWKLIVYPKAKRVQLFDLPEDPDELRDRGGDPGTAEVRSAMASRLRDWLKANGDAEWESVGGWAGR